MSSPCSERANSEITSGQSYLGPPDFGADVEALEATLDAFPPGMQVAVEFRHPTWFTDDVRHVLTKRNVAMCLADRRGPITPIWRTADWAYLRFHEGHASPRSCYDAAELGAWAERLQAVWGTNVNGFAYFNNDGNGCALRDAGVFGKALERRGVTVGSLPWVDADVVLDPGLFIANAHGRRPQAPTRPWGRTGDKAIGPSEPPERRGRIATERAPLPED